MATFNTIKGLIPLLDRRKLNEPFVVDGRNFYVDANGPVSGFGSTYISVQELRDPALIQDFKVGDAHFIFTRKGIYTYDYDACTYIIVYAFASALTTVAPWTMAMVGGRYYFAREGLDLLQYNADTNAWAAITGGNVPPNIAFVATAGGRLAVLTDVLLAWSAIDDGTDFAPSTVTGAGFQLLAIVGGGKPLGLLPTVNGLMSYTTTGLLNSQLVKAINPFNHVVRSKIHIPVSPYCILEMNDNINVFLTKNGLYTTDGVNVQAYQPMMSEFLHREVLPAFNFTDNPQLIRLTFNYDNNLFLISFAQEQIPHLYTKAYVLYVPSDEWGSFDEAHTGFISAPFSRSPVKGYNFGYVSSSGKLHRFTHEALVVKMPSVVDNPHYYAYRKPVSQLQARTQLGIYYFPDVARFRDVEEKNMVESGVYDLYAALYDTRVVEAIAPTQRGQYMDGATYVFSSVLAANAALQIIQPTKVADVDHPLNAEITIGTFAIGDMQGKPETFFTITDLMVGMNPPTGAVIYEDYAAYTDEVIVEYAELTADVIEDWAEGAGTLYSDYTITMAGSLDSYITYAEEFSTPSLEVDSGRVKKFSTAVNGMYHLLNLAADVVGHAFHIKSLSVNGFISGRL